MTLDELQVVITANIAQLAPQIREAQKHFQNLSQTAGASGEEMEKSVSDSSAKTEKALDSESKAQEKSAESAKKSAKQKAQTMEDYAALAKRAVDRANASLRGSGDGGPLHEPVELSGAPPTATERMQRIPSTSDPVQPEKVNALQRLQELAQKARQSLTSVFSDAKSGAASADSEIGLLNSRLAISNQKAEIERQKLIALQAEYGKAVSKSGMENPDAVKLQEQILNTRSRLVSLRSEAAKTAEQIQKLNSGLNESGRAAQKAASGYKTASSGANGFQRELSRMGRQIASQIIVYELLFKSMSALGTYMWSALKTNSAFSDSLNNLKVQFLTAFNPIYQAALPALTALINALAKAMTYVAAFLSGFFGTTYAASEKSAAGLNNNIKALQNTEKAAKDAKESLAGFDEINTLGKNPADAAPSGADAALTGTNFNAPSAKPLISPEQIAGAEAAGERIRKVFEKIGGALDFSKMFSSLTNAVVGVTTMLSIATLAVGAVLVFSGANPALGLGLMAVGAAGFAAQVALNWGGMSSKTRDEVTKITAIVGTSMLALGTVLTFTGAAPALGIPMMAIGAGSLASTVALNWNGMTDKIRSTLTKILAIAGGAMLALGIILCFTPAIPLGVALIAIGAAELAGAVALNWNSVVNGIKTAFSAILAIASTASVAIGLILCLTGAGIPLGIGLIMAGMAGVHAAGKISSNPITQWAKDMMNGIISVVETGVNWCIDKLNTLSWTVPDWVPLIGGNRWGFSLGRMHLPRLAQGGIVDGETTFIAGEHGREAVIPLQNNTGWLDSLADKLSARVPPGGNGPIHLTMPVYLDKNGGLVATLVKEINLQGTNGGRTVLV